MSSRPIILLDIDGVLNPLCSGPSLNTEWEWRSFWSNPELDPTSNSGALEVHFAPEMLRELLSIPADLRWLTTWMWRNESANKDFAVQTNFRHLPTDIDNSDRKTNFKFNVVERLLSEEGPPIIWIDDDIEKILADFLVTIEDIDPHIRLFPVCPKSSVGLTRKNLMEIKFFTEELK